VVSGKVAELCEVVERLLVAADLDQPTRTLLGEPREGEDETGEHDVHAVGYEPLSISGRRDVDGGTP